MLAGRESLVRLVGKRRRFLPNGHSLSTLVQSNDGEVVSVETVEGLSENSTKVEDEDSAVEMVTSDWVICPVCGNRVRGEAYNVNCHLDSCLSRGTKRKLTQRTLLQMKFCSGSVAHTSFCESEQLETNVDLMGLDNNEGKTALSGFIFSSTIEGNYSNCVVIPSNPESSMETCMDGSTVNGINSDGVDNKVEASLAINNEVPNCDMAVSVNNLSGLVIETFIVGRRFSDEKEINLGAAISLLRDPKNVKDPNAIKVISADAGCSKVLGFLPRDLAQHLSPLIDKYSLIFEGSVTSIPKHSLNVVPIQIVCCNMNLQSSMESGDIEVFTFLWKNVLTVATSAKIHPPDVTKYQQNFCLLLQEVLRSNPHLFTDDEKEYMESFTSLPVDSQRLFVRLYMRKGPWFRMSNILYREVLNSQEAVKALCAGYLRRFEDSYGMHDNEMKEILDLVTLSELREIMCMLKKNCKHGTRKQDLIASLVSLYKDGLCLLLPNLILDRTGTCIKISSKVESLLWRAERLFFLNSEQDLSAFLLVDMGVVKYPTYRCIISEPIFTDREDLLAYEEAIGVAQLMDQSLDDNDKESVLRCMKIADSRMCGSSTNSFRSTESEPLVIFLSCFSASWVYSKVVLLGVSFLEREHRYNDAIVLLKRLLICFPHDGRRGYWRMRLSIDLEHMGCPNESLSVAEDGLVDPWVRAGSKVALQRRVLRLAKPPRRWKVPSFSQSVKREIREVHIQGRPLNCETGMKSRFYGEDGEQCGVEQLALQYYAGEGEGWQGVHTESGIWLTIFGLLMWNILFSDAPNVFRTRFQTAPLDLETDSFYEVRKDIIESHLQKIQDGMAEEILITSWELYLGTACRGVNWERNSLSELRAVVTCSGGPFLASLCRYLAQDYRSWSSGMPDLVLWRFHGEYMGQMKLVEVKGPRDRLSEQQRAWLLLLMEIGFNTEICKVSPLQVSS
ncbi:fanconi-associated nuclease 1 homolog isoform X2 [Tripterygium wilfordii]|uniref:fanconi-associated nuclease 1 homolog isoform X2 n=1 Tax=Tripterygium wilfordii TaxID=458696 RepID=UPI0018F7F4EF|nr:fanconi-associated nuclease 1 homolog isoform X2 [Tripterygium wilfordii]